MQNEDYHNQDQSNILKLTETQFKELDVLVRMKAGKVLELYRHESRDDFAYWSMMAGDVVIDTNKMDAQYTMTEEGIIHLSNQIDVERLKATNRPEMDWGTLPSDKIYKFIVLHEIAHTKQNAIDIAFKLRNAKGSRLAMEVNADRQAWKWLFPDVSFPVKKCLANKHKQIINDVLDEFKDYLCWDEELEDRPVKWQLPIAPNRFMPLSHYKHGIPFAHIVSPLPVYTDEEIRLMNDEKDAYLFNNYLDLDWKIPYQQFIQSDEWLPSKNQYHFEVYREEITTEGSNLKLLTRMLPTPKLALDFVNRNHKRIKVKLHIQYGMCLA